METEGEGHPLKDFGHLIVVVAVELLQRKGSSCSNFCSDFSLVNFSDSVDSILEMVEMASFYRLLVAMRWVYEL